MFFRFTVKPALVCTLLISSLQVHPALAQTLTAAGKSAATERFLVLYRNGQFPAAAAASITRAGAHFVERHELLGVSVIDSSTPATRAALARDPAIEAIVPDILLSAHILKLKPLAHLISTPDSLYHSPQGWAVRQVGGFGADGTLNAQTGPWNVTTGRGVRIAILDSGVDPTHPDIAPNLALNLSEVVPSALPSACDDGSPVDQQGHGTWTASLAAGALGANTGLVAGVAPSATLLNIKVIQRMPAASSSGDPTGCINGQAAGLLSWVIQGIEDAITNRADIISLSLGSLVDISTGTGAGVQAVFNRATTAAWNAGIVIIAAAGNDGVDLSNPLIVELPAQSRYVLPVVASTNPDCAENLAAGATCVPGPVTLPYYSNYGASLNALAAPGGSYPGAGKADPAASAAVESGWITGACSSGKSATLSGIAIDSNHSLGCFNLGHIPYVQAMGTSASAPLVAGAAALLLAQHPTWAPSSVIAALRSSASVTGKLTAPQVNIVSLLSSRTH